MSLKIVRIYDLCRKNLQTSVFTVNDKKSHKTDFMNKSLNARFLSINHKQYILRNSHKCKIFYLAYGKKKLTLIESKSQSKIFQSICMNQLQVIHFLYREYSMYANL